MTDKSNIEKRKSPLNNYTKYSGLAFQMIGTILVGFFGGRELDKFLSLKQPIFMAVLSILCVFVSIYYVIKGLK